MFHLSSTFHRLSQIERELFQNTSDPSTTSNHEPETDFELRKTAYQPNGVASFLASSLVSLKLERIEETPYLDDLLFTLSVWGRIYDEIYVQIENGDRKSAQFDSLLQIGLVLFVSHYSNLCSLVGSVNNGCLLVKHCVEKTLSSMLRCFLESAQGDDDLFFLIALTRKKVLVHLLEMPFAFRSTADAADSNAPVNLYAWSIIRSTLRSWRRCSRTIIRAGPTCDFLHLSYFKIVFFFLTRRLDASLVLDVPFNKDHFCLLIELCLEILKTLYHFQNNDRFSAIPTIETLHRDLENKIASTILDDVYMG
ncbi:uncharacterized protein LOC126322609 isoform X2 [Schistocerca gregaria]|uniref:uncharacterized protein LOC126322609 isoform X2 n=1 Tax=Schistocerca gregaria TaxID=7010 RepID=UPI00211E017A|nr:uncharacterized protein LOC126322609 isoform X2 [Schistocerca gregaria]